MPTIKFESHVINCELGNNLRRVFLKAKLPLYTQLASVIHCRGMGTCGTCAVRVHGEVSPMTRVERWRLGFPPHKTATSVDNKLRLACQCEVRGDLQIEKLHGMWGHQVAKE